MAPRYQPLGGQAPRRSILAFSCLASILILALLAITQLSAPANHDSALPLQRANPHEADTPLLAKTRATPTGDKYLLGVGKADITGPVVEINFAGYASLGQVGTGLRQRLYSRAFIVGDNSNPADRWVYLVLDTQGGDTAVRFGILDGLKALGGDYAKYYGQGNVAVTGTHSHSGPGAWFNYLLPQVTSLGFDKQSYQAIVDGAVLSIQRAHESLTSGYLDFGAVNITDGNLSRSLWAYLNNPEEERAKYNTTGDDGSTDKALTLLRFQRASDLKNMGILSWYAVHGTSLLENNTHVTADNKGVAAYLFEQAALTDSNAAPGFVAGFSQANVGDTTPNVLGAYCDDGSGQMCDLKTSTCGGTSQACHGRGPFFQNLDLGVTSGFEIGRRQFAGAQSLYSNLDSTGTTVVGTSVKSFHTYQNMSFWQFTLPNGTQAQTCPAALGHSFAAGTTDGPGAFDFTQSESGSPKNPFWNLVRDVLRDPTPEQVACQQPKPVLLDVGEMYTPYAWSPNIIDVQSLRVGQFVIIISPSEATTMAGRRWRDAVQKEAAATILSGGATPKVVLGGPANTYAHYCATPEEYDIQRYEGASTLYGRHQLDAYINLTLSNLQYLSPTATTSPPPGPSPPDNRGNSLDLITPVVLDSAGIGHSFGDVTAQPSASYTRGSVINATFVGANPRNNLRLEGTFAAIEQQQSDGTWKQVRSDNDWDLVYTWTRESTVLGTSNVVISWETSSSDAAGTYRTKYYGDSKNILGSISAFTGTSNSYTLS